MNTAKPWLEEGRRDPGGPWGAFAYMIERAVGRADSRRRKRVEKSRSWPAQAWLLEHGEGRANWVKKVDPTGGPPPGINIVALIAQQLHALPDAIREHDALALREAVEAVGA